MENSDRTIVPRLQEQINAYKEKTKAIDARAPKKVIEAKARKKRKVCASQWFSRNLRTLSVNLLFSTFSVKGPEATLESCRP